MSKKDLIPDNRIAEILGASRTIPLDSLPSQGPLDLLALRQEVQDRLRSGGGRPTDPEWTLTRSIHFKPEHWERLEELAARLSSDSRRVGPGQVAAILIEKALTQLAKGGE